MAQSKATMQWSKAHGPQPALPASTPSKALHGFLWFGRTMQRQPAEHHSLERQEPHHKGQQRHFANHCDEG